MSTTEARSRTRRVWRMRLLLLLCATVFALACAEGFMRIRQWIKYGTISPSVHQFVVDGESGLRIPQPGLDTGRIQIDSLGFRNPELESPKPAGRVRLAFIGASTTYCAEVSSNAATWPAVVCRRLAEAFPDVSFDFVNAGVPGYTVEQSITNLEKRVRELAPDVIVVYHATNDLSKITRKLAQEAGVYDGKPEDPSALAEVSVLWGWIEKNLEVWRRTRAAREKSGRLDFDAAAAAGMFQTDLEHLLRLAKESARVVAVATFSTQLRDEQPQERQLEASNTSLYYMPYMSIRGLLNGFSAFNTAIRRAAETTGTILIGGENEIPGDREHFVDSVHLTDDGCGRMAERVVARLRGSELFRDSVAVAAAAK